MNFFKSADVKVYPCGFRGYDASDKMFNPKARMTSEEGLIGLGGVGDLRSSYVVSYSAESNGTLDAVIGGYRFKISNVTNYLGANWLGISVGEKTSTSDEDGREKLSRLLDLSSENSSDEFLDRATGGEYYFYGLGYASSANELPDGCVKLHALDSKRAIPAEAYLPKLLDNGAIKNVIETDGIKKSDSAGGAFSLAVGDGAMAKAAYGAAIGKNVSTNKEIDGQTVVGRHSAETDAMFAVGDGDASYGKNSFETGGSDGTKVNEALTVSGKVTLNDELSVAKDTTLKSNLNAAGKVTVTGATTLNDTLSVVKATTFDNGIKIGKYKKDENGDEASETDYKTKIAANGEAELSGVATFKSDSIELLQPTAVTAKLTADELSIAKEELKVESGKTTSKTQLIAADLTASGNVGLGGGIVAVSPKKETTDSDGNITHEKAFDVNAKATFTEKVIAENGLKSTGSLEIKDEKGTNLLTADATGVRTTKSITASGEISGAKLTSSGVITGSTLKATTGGVEATQGDIKAESGTVSAKELKASYSMTIGENALKVQVGDSKNPTNPTSVNITAATNITGTLTASGNVTASDFVLSDGSRQISSVVTKLDNLEDSFTTKELTASTKITTSNIEVSAVDCAMISMTDLNAQINMTGANSKLSAAKLEITSTSDNAVTIGNKSTGTSTSAGNDLVRVYGRITANRYNATSDRRLKENLREYEPKKSILELPIYEYDYINGGKDAIGCMAQDLQEICPEIVSEGSDGYLSIEESKIVYLLLQEVKRLREEVEELKRR